MNMNTSKNKGFTLIELLVVIAIIGILSSVVLASLQNARQRAQNAATIEQVRQYQNAIALFVSENGYYPYPGPQSPTGGIYCLGPSGTNCTWIGASLNAPSSGTSDFAKINVENKFFAKNNFFIKIAEAAKLSNYISLPKVNTPRTVINNAASEGAVYVCTSYNPVLSNVCDSAEIRFIIVGNQKVNKGTVYDEQQTTSGTILTQKADDPSGGIGNANTNPSSY